MEKLEQLFAGVDIKSLDKDEAYNDIEAMNKIKQQNAKLPVEVRTTKMEVDSLTFYQQMCNWDILELFHRNKIVEPKMRNIEEVKSTLGRKRERDNGTPEQTTIPRKKKRGGQKVEFREKINELQTLCETPGMEGDGYSGSLLAAEIKKYKSYKQRNNRNTVQQNGKMFIFRVCIFTRLDRKTNGRSRNEYVS